MTDKRTLADQAFSRAAGAPLSQGNRVRLLKDAAGNYPAWLEAIAGAKHHIYLENYIITDDETGRRFADALIARAQEKVKVRLIYDWVGCLGKTSRRFWNRLRASGIDIRCYNPPRFDSPLGWLSRDHRKMLSVDGQIGFITGLCIGQAWEGIPKKKLEPWRDTGVEVIGAAVAEIERAFADIWSLLGQPIPEAEGTEIALPPEAGEVSLRVVASLPTRAGVFRLDQLIAALAKKRVWLTDAYYAGTNAYVQALRSAAKDGVDVRLLVPGGSDLALLRPISRAGYRPLLEAGVRVFEWNGSMLHAKTAVADGRWARVGSSNLNLSSWFGNCELDAVIENEAFALEMEEMYLKDLENATELVLDVKQKLRAIGKTQRSRAPRIGGGGSVGRTAAGAVRIGSAVTAAFTNRRVLESVESRLMATFGVTFLLLAVFFAFFPRILAYGMLAVFVLLGISLLLRSYHLHRERKR